MNTRRIVGIDFLRIISMFMITMLHVMTHGGIIDNVSQFNSQYFVVYALYIICYCSVNCFALISGYVNSVGDSRTLIIKRKFNKYVCLWFQMVFYQIIILLVYSIVMKKTPTLSLLRLCVLPVCYTQYWYLTAYIGMVVISPLVDYAFEKLCVKTQLKLSIIISLVFTLPTILRREPFNTGMGYSVIWLLVLYILGKALRQVPVFNRKVLWAIFWGSAALTYISKIVLDYFYPRVFWKRSGDLLILYTSPTILLMSVALVLLCSQMAFKFSFVPKMIIAISPFSLGIYLLHDNALVRENLMKNTFLKLSEKNAFILIIVVLVAAFFINVLGYIIEIVRNRLFYIIKINELCRWIVDFCNGGVDKFIDLVLEKGDCHK